MVKILSIAEIHSETENILNFILHLSKTEIFDYIVFNGDLAGNSMEEEFVIETILEILKTANKPLITIPGNNDGRFLEILKFNTHLIHNNYFIVNNKIVFFGYGGARTPIKTSLEPTEEELKIYLNNLYQEIKHIPIKVLVTHMPPKDTRLDLVRNTHVGSEEIRNFILKNKINLTICAHIIEAHGYDLLGNTLVINPGKFSEGNYTIIDINEKNGSIEFQQKNILREKVSELDLWLKI